MSRYDVAFYGIGFLIGAIVGALATQAGYGFPARVGWIAVVIALALSYGPADAARKRRR